MVFLYYYYLLKKIRKTKPDKFILEYVCKDPYIIVIENA